MRLRTIGLALAVGCLVAASGGALAQFAAAPPGPFMPAGAMWAPGGGMPPPPPGGSRGGPPGGPMMGGYPGMPPVMAYPPPPQGDGVPCGCCGPSCCVECCDEYCPAFGRLGGCHCDAACCGDGSAHWRARFESVLWTFDLPDQPAILTTTGNNDTAGINSLDFDREFGLRLSLEGKLPGDGSVELVFLGFLSWEDNVAIADPTGTLTSPYQTLNGLGVVPYDNAVLHEYDYTSDLWSFEANCWAPGPCWGPCRSSVMIGFRYVQVDEEFLYNATDVIGGVNVLGATRIEAANHIPFLQLGAMGWVPIARRVSLRFDGKLGAGYNFAGQDTDIATAGNPAGDVAYSESADTNKGAFLIEAGAIVAWQINCYVAVYGGYQILWLDELVLAPDNFNATFPTGGFRPVLIEDTADRLYEGLVGGLEVTW